MKFKVHWESSDMSLFEYEEEFETLIDLLDFLATTEFPVEIRNDYIEILDNEYRT